MDQELGITHLASFLVAKRQQCHCAADMDTTSAETSLMSVSVNLTFAGKHGSDIELLSYAYDFEQRTKRRIEPPLTPALESNRIPVRSGETGHAPTLEVRSAERIGKDEVELTGVMSPSSLSKFELEARVDGQVVPRSQIVLTEGTWSLRARFTPYTPVKATYGGYGKVVGNVVVVLVARSPGRAAGKLVLISQDN